MELKEKLKEKGLNMSEKYLNMLLDDVLDLGEMLVNDSANPFDDVGFQAIKMFEGELRKLIDKVDGEES